MTRQNLNSLTGSVLPNRKLSGVHGPIRKRPSPATRAGGRVIGKNETGKESLDTVPVITSEEDAAGMDFARGRSEKFLGGVDNLVGESGGDGYTEDEHIIMAEKKPTEDEVFRAIQEARRANELARRHSKRYSRGGDIHIHNHLSNIGNGNGLQMSGNAKMGVVEGGVVPIQPVHTSVPTMPVYTGPQPMIFQPGQVPANFQYTLYPVGNSGMLPTQPPQQVVQNSTRSDAGERKEMSETELNGLFSETLKIVTDSIERKFKKRKTKESQQSFIEDIEDEYGKDFFEAVKDKLRSKGYPVDKLDSLDAAIKKSFKELLAKLKGMVSVDSGEEDKKKEKKERQAKVNKAFDLWKAKFGSSFNNDDFLRKNNVDQIKEALLGHARDNNKPHGNFNPGFLKGFDNTLTDEILEEFKLEIKDKHDRYCGDLLQTLLSRKSELENLSIEERVKALINDYNEGIINVFRNQSYSDNDVIQLVEFDKYKTSVIGLGKDSKHDISKGTLEQYQILLQEGHSDLQDSLKKIAVTEDFKRTVTTIIAKAKRDEFGLKDLKEELKELKTGNKKFDSREVKQLTHDLIERYLLEDKDYIVFKDKYYESRYFEEKLKSALLEYWNNITVQRDSPAGLITLAKVEEAKQKWADATLEDKQKTGSRPSRRIKRAEMYRAELDYKDLLKRYQDQIKDNVKAKTELEKVESPEKKAWYRKVKELLVNRNEQQKNYYIRMVQQFDEGVEKKDRDVRLPGRLNLWWNSLPVIAKSALLVSVGVGTGGWLGATPWLASTLTPVVGMVGAKVAVGATVGAVLAGVQQALRVRADRLLLSKEDRSRARTQKGRDDINEEIRTGKRKHTNKQDSYKSAVGKGAAIGLVAGGAAGAAYGLLDQHLLNTTNQTLGQKIGGFFNWLIGNSNTSKGSLTLPGPVAPTPASGASTASGAVLSSASGDGASSAGGIAPSVAPKVAAYFELPRNARGGALKFFSGRNMLHFGSGAQKPYFTVDGGGPRGGKVSAWSVMQALGMSEEQIGSLHKRQQTQIANRMKFLIDQQFGTNRDLELNRTGKTRLLRLSPNDLLHRLPKGLKIPIDIFNDVGGAPRINPVPSGRVLTSTQAPGTFISSGATQNVAPRPGLSNQTALQGVSKYSQVLATPSGKVNTALPTDSTQITKVHNDNILPLTEKTVATLDANTRNLDQFPATLKSLNQQTNFQLVTREGTIVLNGGRVWPGSEIGQPQNLIKISEIAQQANLTKINAGKGSLVVDIRSDTPRNLPIVLGTKKSGTIFNLLSFFTGSIAEPSPSIIGSEKLGVGSLVLPSYGNNNPAIIFSPDSKIPAQTIIPKGAQILLSSGDVVTLHTSFNTGDKTLSALELAKEVSSITPSKLYNLPPRGRSVSVKLEYTDYPQPTKEPELPIKKNNFRVRKLDKNGIKDPILGSELKSSADPIANSSNKFKVINSLGSPDEKKPASVSDGSDLETATGKVSNVNGRTYSNFELPTSSDIQFYIDNIDLMSSNNPDADKIRAMTASTLRPYLLDTPRYNLNSLSYVNREELKEVQFSDRDMAYLLGRISEFNHIKERLNTETRARIQGFIDFLYANEVGEMNLRMLYHGGNTDFRNLVDTAEFNPKDNN